MNKNEKCVCVNMIQLVHDKGTVVNSWQQSDELSI